MSDVINRYVEKKLPRNLKVVDKFSGEDKAVEGSLIVRTSNGKINVPYKKYVYLNLESLNYAISNGIKQVELGLILSLCNNLMTNENICMQENGEPHNTKSIAKLIGQEVQPTRTKLKELIEKGLLNHSRTRVDLKLIKVYRINPHLIKKGLELNQQLAELFNKVINKPSLQHQLKNSQLNKPKK
jgi:hypothetical protein